MLKYEKAIVLAAKAHKGQRRKGTNNPYIIHPYTVAMLLLEEDCSEEIVIAAILHDTVEDTGVTLEEINRLFGSKVMELVRGASEPDKSLSWQERKQHTIDYIKTATLQERLLIVADKLHNIVSMVDDYQELGEELWVRFNGDKEQQCWYYRSLVAKLCNQKDIPENITLFKRFETVVADFFGLA